MNNKVKTIILSLILIIISFSFLPKASAVAVNVYSNNQYIGIGWESNGNQKYFKANGIPFNRFLTKFNSPFFMLNNNDNYYYQLYCIDPGIAVGTGDLKFDRPTDITIKGNNGINLDYKLDQVLYVLTYAYYLEPSSTFPNYSEYGFPSYSEYEFSRIMAAQGIIWEIMTGERVTFNNYQPDNCRSDGFYVRLFDESYCNSNICNMARTEYNLLIDKVNAAKNVPSGFYVTSLESNNYKTPLYYDDNTGKYTTTICDVNRYFIAYEPKTSEIDKPQINDEGRCITLSSSTAIEESAPKNISLHLKATSERDTTFVTGEKIQDLMMGRTDREVFIKVYTPKYQLKINKVSKIGAENEGALSGVKFNVYNNAYCTSKIGETTSTDQNGEAIYADLKNYGRYYVQEDGTVPGYNTNKNCIPVDVSKNDFAGTGNYSPITVTNIANKVQFDKKVKNMDGSIDIIEDYDENGNYVGPEFEMYLNGNNDKLYFTEISPGNYKLASKDTLGAVTSLKTNNGSFSVYKLLMNINYMLVEIKAPKGLTLPEDPNLMVSTDSTPGTKYWTIYNGVTGLIFEKKDEKGNYINGGTFKLQHKVSNIYKDLMIKEMSPGKYNYVDKITDKELGATYFITTVEGTAFIEKLPPGEYRVVEVTAPEGYDMVEENTSTAVTTIKDSASSSYRVELINKKTSLAGSRDKAEFVIAINTGRKVPNYMIIISAIVILLIGAVIARKKMK
ncbi:MAG: SpaA isopeptide-forming pilin-related protein [Bacilli bacterium]